MGIVGDFNIKDGSIKITPKNPEQVNDRQYLSKGIRGPLDITGDTQDGKHFIIEGNSTGRNWLRTENIEITRIKVGDRQFKLDKNLNISVENNTDITKSSLKDIKKLVENHWLRNKFSRIRLIEESQSSFLERGTSKQSVINAAAQAETPNLKETAQLTASAKESLAIVPNKQSEQKALV